MRYTKTINIHALNPTERKALQVGQWVTAGNEGPKGIWCGQRQTGTNVVAWLDNAKRADNYRDYVRTLIAYGTT